MATTETKTTEHTTEHTAQAEGHGAFPPLDAKSFPSQLFWLVIFFSALYLLMSRLVLPKLGAIIGGRKAQIDGDLARASALKEETETALKNYEKALTDARSKASDIGRETRASVSADIDAAKATFDDGFNKKIKDAEVKVAKAKAKALESLDSIASESAAEIVASLTGSKVLQSAASKAVTAAKR